MRQGQEDDSTAGIPSASRAPSLRIMGERVFASRVLPSAGELVLGRSQSADVRIDDASVSRRHAVIRVGPPLSIEDTGSAHGTQVGSRRLAQGERALIAPGDTIHLGSVVVVVEGPVDLAVPGDGARAASDGAELVIADPATRALHQLVERVAAGSISVLLLGETGVGKEVVAESLHRRSARAGGPFLRINCASLSETLLESELFGHERGAFTGALQAKPGLLEISHGGTVFLDEVGELPPALQARLLRVLEERQVLRVGALKPRPLDVRFVAATNRDLAADVESGRFRRDLFYRLNGVSIEIPPLRERLAEIEALARTFALQAARRAGRPEPSIAPEAIELLVRHPWPGNVRELRNVIERAVLVSSDGAMRPEHLALDTATATAMATAPRVEAIPAGAPELPRDLATLQGEMQALERQELIDALAQCAGNQTQAARLLGISRGTLLTRIEAHDLPRPRKRG